MLDKEKPMSWTQMKRFTHEHREILKPLTERQMVGFLECMFPTVDLDRIDLWVHNYKNKPTKPVGISEVCHCPICASDECEPFEVSYSPCIFGFDQ